MIIYDFFIILTISDQPTANACPISRAECPARKKVKCFLRFVCFVFECFFCALISFNLTIYLVVTELQRKQICASFLALLLHGSIRYLPIYWLKMGND